MLNNEIFEKFCEQIEFRPVSSLKILKEMHISCQELNDWLNGDANHATRYARAKEKQIEALVDEMSELEDKCLSEVKNIDNPKIANALVQAYKIKIDNIKWLASKLKAKKFGDKLAVDHSGGLSVTRVELPKKCAIGAPVNNND